MPHMNNLETLPLQTALTLLRNSNPSAAQLREITSQFTQMTVSPRETKKRCYELIEREHNRRQREASRNAYSKNHLPI